MNLYEYNKIYNKALIIIKTLICITIGFNELLKLCISVDYEVLHTKYKLRSIRRNLLPTLGN